MAQEIRSDQEIGIDHNFRVSAGPGAGKTHWLTTHVRNVVRKSRKLSKTGQVACITYTNTGAEEIRGRLGASSERVSVSTIHSFLYNNVVDPYSFLLVDQEGRPLIDLRHMDGHEEHIPSPGIVYRWKKATGQSYLKDDVKVQACLQDLDWLPNDDGGLALLPRNLWRLKVGRYSLKKESLIDYKKFYWNKGRIHHEDVLFFSFRVIHDNPQVLAFLCAKYPYIFVDEFQDTNPIQTAILKEIAAHGSVVGIVGDPAQSIFKFQGARRQDFLDFSTNRMEDYWIGGNRRSTNQIVQLLNRVRGDGKQQEGLRNASGSKPIFLIGNWPDAVKFVESEADEITILARNNDIVNQIRSGNQKKLGDLWVQSRLLDSNYERQRLIHDTMYGVELLFARNYHDARKAISGLFKWYANGGRIPKENRRVYAIALLDQLVKRYRTNIDDCITNYNNWLYQFVNSSFGVKVGAQITSGPYKTGFADVYSWGDLSSALKVHDDFSSVRTIHKAKGAEFDSVLVIAEDNKELSHIIRPNTGATEDDSRIYYVALSRAKEQLFVTAPSVKRDDRKLICDLGFELKEL